ncbi:MAG: phospholipid/cholesterol/gamma-HCH transport system substrate-binding protein, partial [Mycobacterium sp.]|nr:phospholipid/cholesterol/gamma-HCH transport system substrate-binding protein [Mycobacterium sp.]
NFPPLGINPFAGASARPNEITFSEDRLNPHLPPQVPANTPAAVLNDPAEPLAAEAAIGDLPPEAASTDPGQGLQGLMVPGGTP